MNKLSVPIKEKTEIRPVIPHFSDALNAQNGPNELNDPNAPMRLTQTEAEIIKSAIQERDPQAKVYLFGSRVDDAAKGGDIDILVISTKLTFSDKLAIKTRIFMQLEEQKIDMVIAADTSDPFVRLALAEGVPL